MIYFTTNQGKVSKINLVSLVAFIVGVIDIVKPFIPAEYMPYILAGVAVVTFALRTFVPSSGDVNTSLDAG